MASLASLLKQEAPDAEEVVKACNAELKQNKGDTRAQHVKIVALLQQSRFDDAIRAFEEYGDGVKQAARLEYAYALYKTGELEQAREVASGLDEKAARHLEAQSSYRLEDFASAAQIYRKLWENREADEESDLRINGGATDAQLTWSRQGNLVEKKKPSREDLEAFESAYNSACGSIARGELGQAEILLKRAKDLCLGSDILSGDEIKDELLPITVQQLYVLKSLGKNEQAESLLKDITISDIPDQATRMIAQMNATNIPSGPTNPYLSQRIASSNSNLDKNDRPFGFQNSIVKHNQRALDLLAYKFNGVVKSTARYMSDSPALTIDASVNAASSANAAARTQNKLGKTGLKAMLPLLEKQPSDIGLLATIIQLCVLTNNYGAASTVIDGFVKRLEESKSESEQDVRYAPGLVAILVSLYSAEGRKSQIESELAKAASYWRHKSKCPPELLRVAGLSLLNTNDIDDQKEAGKIFDTLHQQDKSDKFAAAGLVAAYALTDLSKVKSQTDGLTAVNRLTVGIDVDALESAGVPQSKDTVSALLNRKRRGANVANTSKKRKVRLPKDYDPNKKPDPERWLPLRDRSSYRPKGKKGKQKQAALTQGGIEKEAEAPKQAPAAAGRGGGGGGGKAKKKKGKK